MGEIAPKQSLLHRRPRSRSKDRRYSVESGGAEMECERQDWRSASARFPPASPGLDELDVGYPSAVRKHMPVRHPAQEIEVEGEDDWDDQGKTEVTTAALANRVPSSTKVRSGLPEVMPDVIPANSSPITPFLRENIPSEEEDIELHRSLTEHWYERQAAVRGLGDALAKDDTGLYGRLLQQIDLINRIMHQEFQACREELEDPPDEGSSSSSEQSLRSEPKFRQVDSLPLDSPRSSEVLKKSYKDVSVGTFSIQLSYQGVETYRVVNDNMPLRVVFVMAMSYLQTEFGFTGLSLEDIDLEYEEQLLPRTGVLGEVPVLDQAVIVILFPRYQGTPTRTGTPDPIRKSNRSMRDENLYGAPDRSPSPAQPTRATHVPSMGGAVPHLGPTHGRIEESIPEFQGSPSTSLDSKSYDKIRQSFKCPKFSGQAREWKAWHKGFLRYLSIWELDYVLDP